MIVECLLIVAGGLLGSAHCLGMCGGFVLTLGAMQPGWLVNLTRQSVYAVGRVFTYSVGGALAGFGGMRLSHELQTVVNVQALLSILAGSLLVLHGLASAGILRLGFLSKAPAGCAGPFASLLRAKGMSQVLAAGVLNGLLPCGLVYAFLALASSTGDMWRGAGTMALFGFGTMPAMVLTGLAGTLLSVKSRRNIFRVAAWCMILTGVLALSRGFGFMDFGYNPEPANCPLCEESPN